MKDWPHPLDPDPSAGGRLLLALEATGVMILMVASAVLGITGAWGRPAPPIVPRGRSFTCTAVRLWDGDGPVWCREGERVRLARINARELDGSCRPHAPCVRASGLAAREHLAGLLGGVAGRTADGHILLRPVVLDCRSDGWGKGERTAAWCRHDGRDLSAAMVDDGFAARWANPHPR